MSPEPSNYGTDTVDNHLTHPSDVRLKTDYILLVGGLSKSTFKIHFTLMMIQSSMKTDKVLSMTLEIYNDLNLT